MPNPENIEKLAAATEKLVAGVGKEGGVVNAAEKLSAGAEEAVKGDTKGSSFIGKMKSLFKGGAAAGAGAGAEHLLNGGSSSADNTPPNTDSNSTNGAIPNPGANSPAGRIDLPSIASAEDIASGVDADSFSDTRKGSSGLNGYSDSSNRKLNKIISLLESILSVEKNNASMMGTGFKKVENAVYAGFSAQTHRDQTNSMERSSAGGGNGNFLSSMIQNPGKTAMTGLKSLGVSILGAFATGAAVEAISHFGDHSKEDEAKLHPTQDSADHDKVIGELKAKYGKNWAQMLVHEIFNQLEKQNGFLSDLKDSKQKAAGDLYSAIRTLFDKSSKEDQEKIIGQIAALLKIKPKQVRQQIAFVNDPTNQKRLTAGAAVNSAIVGSAVSTVEFLGKNGARLSGLVLGGAESELGSGLSSLGLKSLGNYLQKSGNAFTDKEMDAANDFNITSPAKKWWNKNTSMEAQQAAILHPELYRGVYAGTDAAVALLGPGKLKGAKLGWAALYGGSDVLLGEGKSDLSQMAKDDSIDLSEDHSAVKGHKLTPEVKKRVDQAVEFFQSRGYSKEQAEGIVGNLLVESNYTLDPHQGQIGGGGGYGIAQWTSKSRKKQFASTEGVSLENSTFEQQLDFVDWEFNHTEKKAGDKLKKAKTVSDASKIVTHDYERPQALDQQTEFRATYTSTLFDGDSLKPQSEVASTATPSTVSIQQGGTNISRNTTIQSASAAAPPYLQDNVTASLG